MPTSKEYRQQARECLELPKAAKDLYAKQAMTELAEEFNKAADALERKSAVGDLQKKGPSHSATAVQPPHGTTGAPVRRAGNSRPSPLCIFGPNPRSQLRQ